MDTTAQILVVSGITYIILITVFCMIVAGGIIMLVLVHQKKQLQYFREKEQLKTLFEKEVLQTQLEIQEQTFINISQEIHDNIGQVLSLAKLHINTIADTQPEPLQSKLQDSKHLITKAIQDLRDLSKSLNTDYVNDIGLLRAIEYELEIIQRSGTYQVIFNTSGTKLRLGQQEELILFRIVQEALHNIIKHAKATMMTVEIVFGHDLFTLHISDNGVGFDSSRLAVSNYDGFGLGLRNIYNRSRLINADLIIDGKPGEGTTTVITLPLKIQN